MKNKGILQTVVLGDLIRSRAIEDRKKISRKIKVSLNKIQTLYGDEMIAPLKFTLGMDEISGLFKRPNATYQACRKLNDLIYPYQFRFAIVREKIDIGITTKDSGAMDGPAFHIAANLIEQGKKKDKYYMFYVGPQESAGKFNDWLIEVSNLASVLCRMWSHHQLNIIMKYEKFGKQEIVAGKLGITQQAVSDALKKANWKSIKRAYFLIDEFLGNLEQYNE